MTQFDWKAAGEHLDATQKQHDREQRIGEAQDKLADYEAMRDAMLDFLWSLRRGYVGYPVEDTIGSMVSNIEDSLEWKTPYVDLEATVYHAIHENNRPAAEQAIDDHFAEYLSQARAVANGTSTM